MADVAVVLALSSAAISVSAWGLAQFDDGLYGHQRGWDLYFHADTPRTFETMTLRDSGLRGRDAVHPLFSLLTFPIARALVLLGLEPLVAAKTLVSAAAGLSAALFYTALRGLTLPIHAAVVFTGVLIFSATFIYWFSVVETFAFSGVSVCLMLVVLMRAPVASRTVWALASAFTLSMTVTNWMLGLAAAFFRLPLLRFAGVSAAALGLVTALALVQISVFPTSRFFLTPAVVSGEWKFTQIAREEWGFRRWDPADNLRSFFIYGAVSPGHRASCLPWRMTPPRQCSRFDYPANAITNVGLPWLGVLQARGPSIALWLSLLAAGIWGIAVNRSLWPVGAALAAFIAGQAALHSVYGDVTFLYAAHFFPALLGVVACAYFAPARRLWLAAALLLLVAGGAGNLERFMIAVADTNALLRGGP